MDYVKLRDLIDSEITIKEVKDYEFKLWDDTNGRMLTSTTPLKDYQKRWQIVTDKGQIDMSQSQVANMLEGVMHAGKSDIVGATFNIKSNGKTGIDIRYYLNPVKAPSEDKFEGFE